LKDQKVGTIETCDFVAHFGWNFRFIGRAALLGLNVEALRGQESIMFSSFAGVEVIGVEVGNGRGPALCLKR
jgi:hypothetical protein